MTAPPRSSGPDTGRTLKDRIYAFGVVASAVLVSIAWRRLLREARPKAATGLGATGLRSQAAKASSWDAEEEYRRELRLYVWGFGLALTLTLVPFGLVAWSVISPVALLVTIGVFACLQIIIHFRCFLHINPPKQNMDDLHLILFSGLLLFFMVSGTIWILANLAMRMH